MTTRLSYSSPNAEGVNTRPHVMGILNVTPDSFSDGGRFNVREEALAHARQMISEGVDILDVGAESTRPGSQPVSMENEWARLEPILADVVALQTTVSIDTYKAETARRACALGVSIVNDVWGLQKDPDMAPVVADAGVHVVMMHNREHVDPDLDIVSDIDRFFEQSMALAQKAGVPKEKQILDPGFGFGKTIDQNFIILNRLNSFKKHGLPLLAGASRKRMIGAVLEKEVDDRLYGSLAVHMIALLQGAQIVRVHDVRAHVDCVRMLDVTRRECV